MSVIVILLSVSLSASVYIPPQEARVGPVYVFEPISEIQNTLGNATYTIRCDQPWACVDSLTYTDGKNTIQFVDENEKGGKFEATIIRITFGKVMRRASRVKMGVPPADRWLWANAAIGTPPTKLVDGWRTDPGSEIPNDAIYAKTACFRAEPKWCAPFTASKYLDKNHRRVFAIGAE